MKVTLKPLYKAPDVLPQPPPVERYDDEYNFIFIEDDTNYFLMIFIFSVIGLALLDGLK